MDLVPASAPCGMGVRHLTICLLFGAAISAGRWDNRMHEPAAIVHQDRIGCHARPDQIAALFSGK
ncbi:hypothetical protein AB0M46_20415 [Dactylosporangium sp. NPDC051485]|uniref:hypothetical protein n=1 Tax=Dactylosporangium sp. NPDC051485 TaxID=3154846 RepID=UPI00342764AF